MSANIWKQDSTVGLGFLNKTVKHIKIYIVNQEIFNRADCFSNVDYGFT